MTSTWMMQDLIAVYVQYVRCKEEARNVAD